MTEPFYELLTPTQRRVWPIVHSVTRDTRAFMVGGTALSLFHLGHRTSEDFDFQVTPEDQKYLPALAFELELRAKENGLSVERKEQPWVGWQFMIIEGVKVDCAVDEVGCRELITVDGLQIASMGDICRMKWATLAGREKLRDAFDLMKLREHGEPIWDRLAETMKDLNTDVTLCDDILFTFGQLTVEARERPAWALPGYDMKAMQDFLLEMVREIPARKLSLEPGQER